MESAGIFQNALRRENRKAEIFRHGFFCFENFDLLITKFETHFRQFGLEDEGDIELNRVFEMDEPIEDEIHTRLI